MLGKTIKTDPANRGRAKPKKCKTEAQAEVSHFENAACRTEHVLRRFTGSHYSTIPRLPNIKGEYPRVFRHLVSVHHAESRI